jgi:hypothetical protein
VSSDSKTILYWILVVAALSPIWLALGWELIDGLIRPALIPRAEIERAADDLLQRYPDDPEAAAFREEHAAWYRSDSYERGRWRRVRKEIQRRLRGG